MSEHFAPAELSNGDRIVLDPSASGGGMRQMALHLRRKDGSTRSVLLPYPRAGLGGGRIIVSPSEQMAVLSIYSGQSEEGYELFNIADAITRVGGLGYEFGEFASYCFSPDETLLVMALAFTCSEWWLPWDDGEAEPDGAERLAFGFGQLRLHEVATGKISVAGNQRELTTIQICDRSSSRRRRSACPCPGRRSRSVFPSPMLSCCPSTGDALLATA